MSKLDKPYLKFDHDQYAKTCDPDDFWGQVRRTVNGRPVSDAQIDMIVERIRVSLNLESRDSLLDIACGNGALSHLLFNSCIRYLGVDLSEHLIKVAKTNFEELPNYKFVQQGVIDYVRSESMPEIYSKVLCYGSFQYFRADNVTEILSTLFEKFSNVETVFIGNLPDKNLASEFYNDQPNIDELNDCHSQIGIWRTRDEFTKLANSAGWKLEFLTMPDSFYASYYRYDALLSR